MPKINDAGLAILKEFEGCRLTAYPDPGTGGEPWTIGYGHTGPEVRPGLTITQEMADTLLREDLKRFEDGVNAAVSRDLTPNEFAALVSFAYNVGFGSFESSTLLKLVNAGMDPTAQFKRWIYGGDGQVMEGLVRRRAAEAALFNKG